VTAPEPPRDSSIDPSDPRWVEDVLARARARAVEGRPSATEPVAPAPSTTVDPAVVAERRPAPEPDAPRTAPTPNPRPQALVGGPVADPRGTMSTPGAGEARPRAAEPDEPLRRSRIDVLDPADPLAGGAARSDVPDDATPGDPGATDPETTGMDRRMRNWLEWGGVIIGALLVAFLIRAVLFQAFYIPSESMESTLEVKDRILVNKLSYKLHDVHRGDIVVFEKPPGETSKINDLIKRVIALPGETIEQQGTDLYIDRGQGPQKVTESYVKDITDIGQPIAWVQGCSNPSTDTKRCTIPEGHVWVMGDNRGHSHDSRAFGPIDKDLIVGRAFVKVWPLNSLGFL
jgi:signal peptidase I